MVDVTTVERLYKPPNITPLDSRALFAGVATVAEKKNTAQCSIESIESFHFKSQFKEFSIYGDGIRTLEFNQPSWLIMKFALISIFCCWNLHFKTYLFVCQPPVSAGHKFIFRLDQRI